jgi:hypothetical protein
MNDDFHLLWGLPILKTKINPDSYNKKEIIDVVEKNYLKQPIRQNWSNSFFNTDIHHSNSDEKNKNFEKPNYNLLYKAYVDPLKFYLKQINLNKNKKVRIDIVNYTASRNASFMEPHIHSECDFSMIHYIQFDKKENNPTVFLNPYSFNDFWINQGKLISNTDESNPSNSWVFSEWRYDVEEDDIIIFPAILRHFVRNKKTLKTRIVVASNIFLTQVV